MAQGPKLTAGYYLLAFIDVLGQRNLLREMHDLPETNNEKQMAEFVALLKKTVGIVSGMRNLFLNYFKGSSLEHFKLSEFNHEQYLMMRFMAQLLLVHINWKHELRSIHESYWAIRLLTIFSRNYQQLAKIFSQKLTKRWQSYVPTL